MQSEVKSAISKDGAFAFGIVISLAAVRQALHPLYTLLVGFDVQVDGDVLTRVEGADGLGGAFLFLIFSPDGVVDVRRDLAEAVAAVLGGDEAADGVGFGVLEVNDRAREDDFTVAEDLAVERLEFDV